MTARAKHKALHGNRSANKSVRLWSCGDRWSKEASINWLKDMIEAGQKPVAFVFPNGDAVLGVTGRPYNHRRDRERWDFMNRYNFKLYQELYLLDLIPAHRVILRDGGRAPEMKLFHAVKSAFASIEECAETLIQQADNVAGLLAEASKNKCLNAYMVSQSAAAIQTLLADFRQRVRYQRESISEAEEAEEAANEDRPGTVRAL